MRGKIIRRILVILIIIAPVFSYSGCKKQVRCGCGKDTLSTLAKELARVYYNDTKTAISISRLNDPFSTYNFCNPGEMAPKLDDYKSGDVIEVSGDVFWDCNYLYQSSNYSYVNQYKVYLIQVTDITVDPYGK